MKKLFFFTLIFCVTVFAQYPVYVVDTVRFVRPADTTSYIIGDIVADSGAHYKYFTFSNIGQRENGSRGKITNVSIQKDTVFAANDTLKVRFFSVSDTTGVYAALPVDNDTLLSKFELGTGSFLWIGDVTVITSAYGTTALGSTGSEGTATASLPYNLYNGKLYCILISQSAFEPKKNGVYRITVWADRQY